MAMKQRLLPFPFLALCFALVLLSVSTVRAESAPPAASRPELTSEQHIARAQELFKETKYSEAGDHLMLAYEQTPQPVLLFNAGQAFRKGLRPVEARNAYQKLITTHPSHPLVPEAKGYVQTLEALIAEVEAKQQIELSMMEQKAKSEKELAEERSRREEMQKELSKYQKPFYKKAWFWLLISGGVLVGGAIATATVVTNVQAKTQGGTQHLSFALTF
jgi:tetratricopeptide (TPR) repeat protein